MVADAAGNSYVSDSYYDRVFRIAATGVVTTYAGSDTGFGGDNGSATAARFNGVSGLALSATGELYICDARNARVRKISKDGQTITTVAGNGSTLRTGDGQAATAASIGNPRGLAFDTAGNLFISDTLNHVVRKVDAAGVISTVAGMAGRPGFGGDLGVPTAALLQAPSGLAVDAQNNLYIADSLNNRVRRVTPQNRIETFAGNGLQGATGQNVSAVTAQLFSPTDVVVNKAGDVFVSDRNNGLVRRVRAGIIATVVGAGSSPTLPGPAATYGLALCIGIALDATEQLLIVDDGLRRVFRANVVANTIQLVAGAGPSLGAGDNAPAVESVLLQPSGVAVDPDGNVFVSDVVDNRVRRIAANGIITTFAGNGVLGLSGNGAIASNSELGRPRGMAMDRNRNLYVASTWGSQIYKISAAGILTVFAGGGNNIGISGDGGLATNARLNTPFGVAVDRNDNVYIADTGNHRIRKVDSRGMISTVAGSGDGGFQGDGGAATAARLSSPRAVVVDSQGNLIIADTLNHRVRKVDGAGIISTIAGTGETGAAADGIAAIEARVWSPGALAFDAFGNLLIAISALGQIRSLSEDGILRVVAGTAALGFAGDGGVATEAQLSAPTGLAVGADGSIYIADQNNERVRKLAPVRLASAGVANRASLAGGAVAANEHVVIQGLGLGPLVMVTATTDGAGRYPKTLVGTQVLFDGAPVPLFSVQDRLVVAAVPASLASDKVRIQISYQGRLTEEVVLDVVPAVPGVFVRSEDGRGPANARNEDGADNTEAGPAAVGSVVTFLATGLGSTNPLVEDGTVVVDEVSPALGVDVTIGGVAAEVVGVRVAAGQTAGIMEVKVRIPVGLDAGSAPLLIRAGGALSQGGVTVWVAAP